MVNATPSGMVAVPSEQVSTLLPLFDFDYPNRSTLISFLEGHSPGVAFVDDLARPTAAIVSTNIYNFSFIGGAPEARWLAEALGELCRQRYLVIVSAAWLPSALTALPEANRILPRLEFLHPQRERQTPPIVLPADYHFRPLDADLLQRCEWRDEMVAGYGSLERFLANAHGVCLMRADEICCETYALFPGDGHYEIGVVTHKDYRGKGFAYATCLRLAAECERRGYSTSWTCDQDNGASIATANKLGYATERAYDMFYYAHHE